MNLNSNASRPAVIERLCEAGLESLRISTNSAQPDVYTAYYNPSRYTFEDVQESGRVIKRRGGYLMLNYFVFPGVSDTREELEALSAWITESSIDMLQLRNLNIDPETYLDTLGVVTELSEPMGIAPWLAELGRRHPGLRTGYFNPPRGTFADPVTPSALDAPGAIDADL
jgi:hypothetical protein